MLTNPPVPFDFCVGQPGEGPSRGLLRDCTSGCGTDGPLHSTSEGGAPGAGPSRHDHLHREEAGHLGRGAEERLLPVQEDGGGQQAGGRPAAGQVTTRAVNGISRIFTMPGKALLF